MSIKKRLVLHFSADIVDKPMVFTLVKKYNLVPNILQAEINPEKEGYLVMELEGDKDDVALGLGWLESCGVELSELGERIIWNEEICTHCGACTGICPTEALSMARSEMKVSFNSEKCIACRMCLAACSFGAVQVNF